MCPPDDDPYSDDAVTSDSDPPPPVADVYDDGTSDSDRMQVVNTAVLEVGNSVHAHSAGDADENGRTMRQGWDRLIEYFHTAAPDVWSDDVVTHLVPGLPAWCGIFALWALKTAGRGVGTWRIGSGISAVSGIRSTREPKAGDIGYLDQPFQHHCIVQRVSADGATVTTIDGNSGNDSSITVNSRPRSAFSAFYTAF